MSTSSLPSAWEEPRQFSLPLPFDLDPTTEPEKFLLVCSSTHVVLGHSDHIYVYSLPTFDLVHVSEGPSDLQALEIHGGILVARCGKVWDESLDFKFEDGCCLYFWDLSGGTALGSVKLPDYWEFPSVSSPGFERVQIEEKGKLVGEDWPKYRTLVISSRRGRFLQTYKLHYPVSQSVDHAVIQDALVEGPTLLHLMTVCPIHWVRCITSLGKTTITGGIDATVRVWDIISGECELVLMGHGTTVGDVRLDSTKIYSSSWDGTVRVWHRHSGDCLHVLVFCRGMSSFSVVDATLPYIILDVRSPSGELGISIWDTVSGQLAYKIEDEEDICSCRVQGKLATWGVDDEGMECLRIWDVRSGKVLMSSPLEPSSGRLYSSCQGRFIVAVIKQRQEYRFKVWEFNLKSCDPKEDDIEKAEAVFSSSSALKETLAGDSTICKRERTSKVTKIIHRIFRQTRDVPRGKLGL